MPTETELDEMLLENERDVGTLRRHGRKLLKEIADLKDKVKQLESNAPAPRKPTSEMTYEERFEAEREAFFVSQAHRLNGLTGDEYAAVVSAITDEVLAQPFTQSYFGSMRQEQQSRLESLDKTIRGESIKQRAMAISGRVARHGCASALMPHVTSRLTCDRQGEEWIVTAWNGDGQPISVDELEQELREAPAFRLIVQAPSDADREAHKRRVAAVTTAPKVH